MSKLRLFYDTLSQPSRALKLFLDVNKIPHEAVAINLSRGEQFQEDYEKINPFKKVPALQHNDFNLSESVAILRYLCREVNVPDHWYPKDSKQRARVDEYLEWQHNNTRLFCAMYFHTKVLQPILTGKPVDEKLLKFYQIGMENTLDLLCDVWLKDKKYLCGEQISIADLLGVCELEQPRLAGYNVAKNRPILQAYMDRVKGDLAPHYGEVMKKFDKFIAKYVEPTKAKL